MDDFQKRFVEERQALVDNQNKISQAQTVEEVYGAVVELDEQYTRLEEFARSAPSREQRRIT